MRGARWLWVWWLVLVGAVPRTGWAGDRLDEARQQAQSTGSSGGGAEVLGALAGLAEALDDDRDDDARDSSPNIAAPVLPDPPNVAFLDYPYANGRRGFAVSTEPGEELPPWARGHAFRLRAEGAYLDDDVWRAGTSITVLVPGLYARLGHDLMIEGPTAKLDGDVEIEGTVRDRLHFARLELGPQIVHEETFAARFGVVGTVMFDDQRSLPVEPTTLPGIGAALELELYPLRPLVFTARGAASQLWGARVFEARVTAAVLIRRFEIYAGYDHRLVGRVPLGGPTLGVAARF